jgi:hypothetical protein
VGRTRFCRRAEELKRDDVSDLRECYISDSEFSAEFRLMGLHAYFGGREAGFGVWQSSFECCGRDLDFRIPHIVQRFVDW